MLRWILDRWPLAAAAASAGMLAAAHAFETFGGLAPCTLCLKQREVYWVAMAIGIAGVVLSRLVRPRRVRSIVCALLALVFFYGAGLAAYHAGVEWKWWPGPDACSGSSAAASADAMADLLKGGPIQAPRCDEAAWVFAGLSMAGWNALVSLALAAASAVAALRGRSRD